MSKNVQHLIKFIPYFSREGKNWEPILPSLIHQGTKPLPVERPRPVPKGLKLIISFTLGTKALSKDPALSQRD